MPRDMSIYLCEVEMLPHTDLFMQSLDKDISEL